MQNSCLTPKAYTNVNDYFTQLNIADIELLRVNDTFLNFIGLKKDSIIIFDKKSKPIEGDLTIIEYNEKKQLVWLINANLMGLAVVYYKFDGYPRIQYVKDQNTMYGRGIGYIDNKSEYAYQF